MDTSLGATDIGAISPASASASLSRARSVSPQRRQQWRKEGACVRCGSQSHWVQQCPMLPTKDPTKPSVAHINDLNVELVTNSDSDAESLITAEEHKQIAHLNWRERL
jgi:hypothetical protein